MYFFREMIIRSIPLIVMGVLFLLIFAAIAIYKKMRKKEIEEKLVYDLEGRALGMGFGMILSGLFHLNGSVLMIIGMIIGWLIGSKIEKK